MTLITDGFGKEMYSFFNLDENYTHTNHASYGAIPKEVIAFANSEREKLQSNPQLYFTNSLPEFIKENASALGEYLGVRGNSIAFTRSATESMNAVLRSLSLLAGDEIITDINIYPSTTRILDFVCSRAGARHVKVSTAMLLDSVDDFVRSYLNAITPRTRVIILEDIAAKTGLIQPIEQIIEECNHRGIAVLIDGAHAVGAIERNLLDLNVDWYIGCLHKWLCVERGAGYIYASDKVKDYLRPMNISHSYYESYPNNFDWPGTGDFSAWLTVKEAIAFRNKFDPLAFHEYCHDLTMWAAHYVADALGTNFNVPARFVNYMAPILMPDVFQSKKIDVKDIILALFELKIMAKIDLIDGKKWVRISAYIYNEKSDYERLVEGIKAIEKDFA